MQASRRSGMTLIEVTAAMALAVLLVAAMTGVLRSLHSQKAALVDDHSNPAWQRQLVNDIRWDLINSHDMVTRPCQLKLLGFSGRDSTSREVTHRLTEVCYTIRESNGKHFLFRRETLLDTMNVELKNSKSQNQELVAIGVTGIFLTSIENPLEEDVVSQLLSKEKEKEHKDKWVPIPQQFRLVLTGENQELIIDEILVL